MPAARIMHVDDEPDVREVVRLSLEFDPQMTVRSCASGEEALAAARDWRPDLMLLDDVMPGMDGLATLAKLRMDRNTASIPIVFMSGRAHARELAHLASLGVAGVLAKPFEAAVLVEVVRKALKPRPSGLEAVREDFLGRAQGYAAELAGCMTGLAAGADRLDGLVNIRQIAIRLANAAAASGFHRVGAEALALEHSLGGDLRDVELRTAIDALLAHISTAIVSGGAFRTGGTVPDSTLR